MLFAIDEFGHFVGIRSLAWLLYAYLPSFP